MKYTILIIALLSCAPFLATAEDATKVKFYEGSFPSIKQNAKEVNRPFFAYFTATWCMPCRLMDQSTWVDPNVVNYIDNNYYAAKIDIDDFDGYEYKRQFNIITVPTIILFHPNGTFMKRHEGSISGTELLNLLKEYDTFEDVKREERIDPGTIGNTPPPVITYSPLPPASTKPATTPLPQSNTYSAPKTNTGNATIPGYQPKPNPVIATGSGLFRFEVARQESEGFSVQVGVYADYENVLKEVSAYQLLFKEPILVHIDKLADRTVYKILIGDFAKRERADKYKEKILVSGVVLEAFIKDLSLML